MILCVRPRKNFFAVGDRLFAQTLNCYDIGWKIFEIYCAPAVCGNAATLEQAMAC